MAQAAAAPAAQAGQFQLVTIKHSAFADILRQENMQALETLLEPQKTGLTVQRLCNDFAACVNATVGSKNDLTTKLAPSGVYACLYAAARLQTTFGDGGLWIIPDGDHKLRPQESEKFLTQRAEQETGWKVLPPVLIYEADEPVRVDEDTAGNIVGFEKSSNNFTAERPFAEMKGAFGKAVSKDGELRIRWFTRKQIEQFREHSASFSSGNKNPWQTDPEAMTERSIRAAMAREILPIRARVPGMTGLVHAPEGIIHDITPISSVLPTAESAAANLKQIAQQKTAAKDQAVPTDPVEAAKQAFERCTTPAELAEVWEGKNVKGYLAKGTQEQRKAIVDAKEARKAALGASPPQQGSLVPDETDPYEEAEALMEMAFSAGQEHLIKLWTTESDAKFQAAFKRLNQTQQANLQAKYTEMRNQQIAK